MMMMCVCVFVLSVGLSFCLSSYLSVYLKGHKEHGAGAMSTSVTPFTNSFPSLLFVLAARGPLCCQEIWNQGRASFCQGGPCGRHLQGLLLLLVALTIPRQLAKQGRSREHSAGTWT